MQLVIFDIDGTLTDTNHIEAKCYLSAFEATFGIDVSDQRWVDFTHVTDWGITEEIIERKFNRKLTDREHRSMIAAFVRQLESEHAKNVAQFKEVPGAKDFFEQLRGHAGYGIGIATGSWEQSAVIKLNSIGISVHDLAFSNSDHFKSREEITTDVIRQLESRISEPIHDIVYFGDGLWDYKTCQNLDVRFIGIDVSNSGRLKSAGAPVVFSDYTDPKSIVEEINKTNIP